jgi:FAD/FMN-containing dehydrogenase
VRALPSLEACELMTREGVELTARHLKISPPLDAPVCVLVETGSLDELASLGIEDAIVADDTASRERLWRLREGHTEAISAAGIPHKLDVGVPLWRLTSFVGALPDTGRTIVFGHLGDGNLHVNVLGPDPDDETVDEAILRLVAEHGGTISAEHGVGVAKARYLGLTRSAAEIEAMRAIKAALDPGNLLNPGAVLA